MKTKTNLPTWDWQTNSSAQKTGNIILNVLKKSISILLFSIIQDDMASTNQKKEKLRGCTKLRITRRLK